MAYSELYYTGMGVLGSLLALTGVFWLGEEVHLLPWLPVWSGAVSVSSPP